MKYHTCNSSLCIGQWIRRWGNSMGVFVLPFPAILHVLHKCRAGLATVSWSRLGCPLLSCSLWSCNNFSPAFIHSINSCMVVGVKVIGSDGTSCPLVLPISGDWLSKEENWQLEGLSCGFTENDSCMRRLVSRSSAECDVPTYMISSFDWRITRSIQGFISRICEEVSDERQIHPMSLRSNIICNLHAHLKEPPNPQFPNTVYPIYQSSHKSDSPVDPTSHPQLVNSARRKPGVRPLILAMRSSLPPPSVLNRWFAPQK